MMNRLVQHLMLVLATLSATGQGEDRPAPPKDVSARIYSSGSVRIRWSRVENADQINIELNGDVVEQESGRRTSSYLRRLPKGKYETRVIAVNTAGASPSNVILFVIQGKEEDNAGDGSEAESGSAPNSPSPLTLEVDADGEKGKAEWKKVKENCLGIKIYIDGKLYTTLSRFRDSKRISIPQTPGKHRVQVASYNQHGETRSNVVTVGTDAEAMPRETSVVVSPTEWTVGNNFDIKVSQAAVQAGIEISLEHDGRRVHTFSTARARMGTAEIRETVPDVLASGASKDKFELVANVGGEKFVIAVVINKATSDNNTDESAVIHFLEDIGTEGTRAFTLRIAKGRGESEIIVELKHNGKVVQSWRRETTRDGAFLEKLLLKHSLVDASADRDGFEFDVFHNRETQKFKVTIIRGITIKVGANRAREGGGKFPISVTRGADSSEVECLLMFDGKLVQRHRRETDGSGNLQTDFVLGGNLVKGSAKDDGFELVVRHGGLEKRFRVTISREEAESTGDAEEIENEDSIDTPKPSSNKQVADRFDFPVGIPNGKGYAPSGWAFLAWTGSVFHPGEDWNGHRGGDSDLGDRVYAVANGKVVASGSYGQGWGDIVLIEHELLNGHRVWSQSAHLQTRLVKVGHTVKRGDVIGTIGKGHNGEYTAHLHFEIRKVNLAADYWPKRSDSRNTVASKYHEPSAFIRAHR